MDEAAGAAENREARQWPRQGLSETEMHTIGTAPPPVELPDQAPEEIAWTVDARGRWSYISDAARTVYGWEPEEMIGRSVEEFLDSRASNDLEVFRRIRAGEPHISYETRHLDRHGSTLVLSITAIAIKNDRGEVVGAAGTTRDIGDAQQEAERLLYMNVHDPLTGLLNRRQMERTLDEHASVVRRYGPRGAVAVLDLDGFREINEGLGHRHGDAVLRRVGSLLASRLRDTDIVARLGGDEFCLLLADADAEEARTLAAELVRTLSETAIVVGGESLRLTGSVGVGLFDDPALTGEEAMANAYLAVDEAKASGCNTVELYTRRRSDQARQRITWVTRLRRALDEHQLVLYRQPMLDLRSDTVNCHELLVRVDDPEKGIVPPSEFMGTAERCGLVREIDQWVVSSAVGQLAAEPGVELSINVSGRTMGDAELPALIERELSAANVEPGRLTVEITETAAIENLEVARRFAEQLAELGCRIGLDDFGAGFGSFTYLKHLPVDLLKIDGEFVRAVARSEGDRTVVGAIVTVAHGFGVKTVGEYVDSKGALDTLRALGVDMAQGFYVGRPAPAGTPPGQR